MDAMLGNQNARKLDTPELMEYAYKSYCAHLATGKSKMSWNLKTPVKLTWQTMETYIKENPTVFKAIDKEIAWSDGFGVWENVVEESAIGKNKDANTASLQMLMRNKYGWDKKDQSNDATDGSALEANEKLMSQLTELQKKAD
jgi:hypothetical protein